MLAMPPLIVPTPSAVAPSLKVIVPLANRGSVELNVTACPYIDGFCDDANVTAATSLAPSVALVTVSAPLTKPSE